MKQGMAAILYILVILGIMAVGAIAGINKVVTLHESVSAAWSQVENQLQRRYDLIPNLVNVVKGYSSHESKLFNEVTKLRTQWAAASTAPEKIKTGQELGGAISRLLLIAEDYPDLKANQNFLTLQAQLEGTENRLAVERNRYNRAVKEFNTYIRTVFGSIFARIKGLSKPAEYFEAEATAKAVPRADFN